MHNFLENELHLELSQEKTLITNASSQAAKFLGYEIKAQRANDYIDPKGRRGANGAIALLVPAKVIESKCQSFKRNGKVTHRNALLQDDDFLSCNSFKRSTVGWFSIISWHKSVVVFYAVLGNGNFFAENISLQTQIFYEEAKEKVQNHNYKHKWKSSPLLTSGRATAR